MSSNWYPISPRLPEQQVFRLSRPVFDCTKPFNFTCEYCHAVTKLKQLQAHNLIDGYRVSVHFIMCYACMRQTFLVHPENIKAIRAVITEITNE